MHKFVTVPKSTGMSKIQQAILTLDSLKSWCDRGLNGSEMLSIQYKIVDRRSFGRHERLIRRHQIRQSCIVNRKIGIGRSYGLLVGIFVVVILSVLLQQSEVNQLQRK